jgi:membrane-associated protease RseP (regulator of RpoE activity)
MTASQRIRPALEYPALVVVTFVVMQTLVVVMHEFTHSAVARLPGHMRSPPDIVWGNPLTLSCRDEGAHMPEGR